MQFVIELHSPLFYKLEEVNLCLVIYNITCSSYYNEI